MPPYLTPGVYIEEVPGGSRTVEPAATSFAAMVGITERGPVGIPTPVTSAAEFTRRFGAPLAPEISYLAHAARGFFANGGERLYVLRLVGPAARSATAEIGDAPAPLRVRASAPGGWGNQLRLRIAAADATFDLTVDRLENGVVAESEQYAGLSPDPTHPRYAPAIVGDLDRPERPATSTLIRLAASALPPSGEWQLSGGEDDLAGITDATVIAGIAALEAAPAISLVAAPGHTAPAIQQALLDHAERMRFRFAVLDAPAGAGVADAIAHRRRFDSSRGALYHPWIGTAEVPAGVPPSGHVMGIIARTDAQRGVWTSPANVTVADATDLTAFFTHGEQDLLNPAHVNVLRDFRGVNRGLRLYGARTLSTDPEWRYIAVRRLLLHIEQSLETGLQWAVFEPNAEPLWAAVRAAATAFLTQLWRSGALAGTKVEEAFFVQAGLHQTMTQADVDGGRLVLLVAVAPTKPAEFTVIRLAFQLAG